VVVIGGSSGMGLATAKMARELGAGVTIVARDEKRLAAAREEIGPDTNTASLDVADEAAVKDLFGSLDAVDHVATLAGTQVFGPIADIDSSMLRRPMDVRFWGSVYICKYAAPKMNGGSITLCSGIVAERPIRGRALGTASTAATEAFGRAMAIELAPIRVNTIRPGAVDTPMLGRVAKEERESMLAAQAKRLPVGRVGLPEDIAQAIVFLMTNSYVTGVTLTVDGGHLLR
jgi:NAD(P)-dependent dehydrogenase (short-subunit alcohol dehydrogenase family)